MKITFDKSALEAALRSIGASAANIGTEQVTLHIYNPYQDKEELSQNPAPGPKFHLTECNAIMRMMRSGKYDRYVASNQKTKHFKVTHFDRAKKLHMEEMLATLDPCRYCLGLIDYQGWSAIYSEAQKRQVLEGFSLEQFCKDFRFIFRCLPLYTTATFPEGNYPPNWAKISLQVRQTADWICSCCNVGCADHHELLHVHHKSGNKGDCKPSNLRVLCAGCHKAQPYHGHMHINPTSKNKLEQLRASQGLSRLCSTCGI